MGFSDRLDGAFTGKFAHLRDRLLCPTDSMPDARSLDDILTIEFFSNIDLEFTACHGETPTIAVRSIWSKWYFTVVLPPLMSAGIWAGCSPPLELDGLRYRVTADGKVSAVGAHDSWFEATPDPAEHFADIHQSIISPFVERYSSFSGVSKRVLWSNAGTVLDSFLDYLERDGDGGKPAEVLAGLIGMRLLPDRKVNKLQGAVRRNEDRERQRKICCLRYMVPDGKLCCICPRKIEERNAA